MSRYILKRLGHALLVIWGAFTLTFLLLYALPSDPVSILLAASGAMGGGAATAADRAAIAARYGLDQPLWKQYLDSLTGILHGDLGTSVSSGLPVSTELAQAIPSTLELALAGLAIGIVLGTLIAVAANLTRSRRLHRLLLTVPPLLASVPSFWLALVLMQVVCFQLGWLPSRGDGGLSHLVLPALTLGLGSSTGFAQVLARGIAQSLREPYVTELRAKGLSRWSIQVGHVLRNAFLPCLTMLGTAVGGLFAGAVITETVYSRAGVGRLLQQAVGEQDMPVVLVLVLLAATTYALVNLAVDLLYPRLDPRLRPAVVAVA
ncbi:ABC transporter permease [Actinomyces oricola]